MHAIRDTVSGSQLAGVDVLAALPSEQLELFAKQSKRLEVARGARVLSRGENLDGLYGVLDGRLKIYMLSCDGDERVIRVVEPGQSFGEVIVFNGIPSPVYVETLTAASLAFVPREWIGDALMSIPEFPMTMVRGLSTMVRELIVDIESVCLQSARQRTVGYLLRRAEQGDPPYNEAILPGPKAMVASLLNLSAETFSRELHALEHAGLITIDKRRLHLRDRDGLLATLGQVSDTDQVCQGRLVNDVARRPS